MIEQYSFGSIAINGKTYNEDIEVRWNNIVLPWWRKESHLVLIEDIKRAIKESPETIVIATGETGMMKISEEVQSLIQEKGIKLIIDRTEEAVKVFNIILEKENVSKVIGLFHLTC